MTDTPDLFQLKKVSLEAREHAELERVFFGVVAVLGRPTSFLDVGCGDGWLVRAAHQLGAHPSLGVGSEADKRAGKKWAPIIAFDIMEPFELDCLRTCKFQLVLNLQPADPVNLCNHMLPDGHIVTNQDYTHRLVSLGLRMDRESTARLASALRSLDYEVYTCQS